jgi:mgtE-like transporter
LNVPQVRGRDFLKSLTQSLLSLSFNITGLLAGFLLSSYFNVFNSFPWTFILYPGILSVRGAIGGLFSGRLSTGLHLGLFEPSLRNNTREAYLLFDTITVLTLISSVFMGVTSSIFSFLQGAASLVEIPAIFLVVLATMGLSIILISPFTFGFSVLSYKRGFDPDMVVYPVISTFSDIVVTLCYVGVLIMIKTFNGIHWVILILMDLFFIYVVLRVVKENREEEDFRETIREFIMTLSVISIIVNITGSALGKITDTIGKRLEIYTVYPALIDTVGDAGSIVGSTATTKMFLGTLPSSITAVRYHLKEIFSSWIATIVLFEVYAVISSLIYGLKLLPLLSLRLLTLNLILIPLIILVSMGTAVVTRSRGLDPDNFVIPIETSISDGLTTIVLYLILIITS